MDESDLRFYIAVALLQRLGRGEFRKEAGAERLLGALDVAVLGTVWDAASAAA